MSTFNKGLRTVRRPLSAVMAIALFLMSVVVMQAIGASSASAAAGDPFDPAEPSIFVVSGEGRTDLYRAVVQPNGSYQFRIEGTPGPQLNALAYNSVDNFLYAYDNDNFRIVKIGEGGRIVDDTVASGLANTNRNSGTFAPGTNTMYLGFISSPQLWVADVASGNVRSVTLSEPTGAPDLTFKDGFLWGFRLSGEAVRVNPTTGQVDTFPRVIAPDVTDQAGATWTFGNGNLGLLRNDSGTVLQIRVTNPGSATPTFTTVSRSTGPASSNNDGTSSQGLPVDLAIEKTGPATIIAGTAVTYDITVTNLGQGNSSGAIVTDAVPAAITGPTASSGNCTVTGQNVECLVPPLAVGGTFTFTITGTAAAGTTGNIQNTATVVGNEDDPNPTNDSSTTTGNAQPPTPGIAIDKQHETPVDVNASGLTDAGDTVQYTFTVTNTGGTALENVRVGDPLVGAVTCDATTLAIGASTTCRANAVYTVTEADERATAVNNTATASANPPGVATDVTATDTDTVPVETPEPELTLQKFAGTPVDVNASTITDAGDTIQYTFTVANSGTVPVSAIAVNDPLAGAVTCDATVLAVNATTNCRADAVYTVTEDDEVAGDVTNTASATGTDPDGGPVVSNEATTVTPVETPDPRIELDKRAGELVDANGDGRVTPGDTIQFSFTVTNPGNVPLRDIVLEDPMLGGAIDCPQTTLTPGASMDCTGIEYAITQDDVDAGAVENVAEVTGTPPSDPPLTGDDTTETPTPGVGGLALVKTSALQDKDRDGAADVGEVISYTFVVTNTGTITLEGIAVDDPMLKR